MRFSYRRFPRIVLVSGGIGITPALSVLREIYNFGGVPLLNNSAIHEVHVTWVVQTIDQFNWFRSLFDEFAQKAAHSGPILDLKVHLTKGQPPDEPTYMLKGRPNLEDLFPNGQHSNLLHLPHSLHLTAQMTKRPLCWCAARRLWSGMCGGWPQPTEPRGIACISTLRPLRFD